jgi:hypothetical protein
MRIIKNAFNISNDPVASNNTVFAFGIGGEGTGIIVRNF